MQTVSIQINGRTLPLVRGSALWHQWRRAQERAARRPKPTIKEVDVTEAATTESGGVAADRLRSFVERVERLQEEQKGLADDVKDVFAEMKAAGYCVKTVRRLLRLRKMEKSDRQEQAALLSCYAAALGMDDQLDLFGG